MPILNLAILGRLFRAGLFTGLSFAILPTAYASPITLTVDPGVVVAGASQFTFDTLNGAVYERIDLIGNNFVGSGFEQINSASLNNVLFNPSGNGSDYTLYLAFHETGIQSLPNFNGSSTGTLSTMIYTLYEVAGASSFGIDGSNNPFVTNSSGPITLAIGLLQAGSTSFSTNPLGEGSAADVTFNQLLAGFVASPDSAFSLDLTQSANPNQLTVLNNGQTFTVNGGAASLTADGGTPIAATPEPSSLLLLLTGLVAVAAFRRRVALL